MKRKRIFSCFLTVMLVLVMAMPGIRCIWKDTFGSICNEGCGC